MPDGRLAGLTSEEARGRLAAAGPNETTVASGRSIGRILRETMREPMFGLLLAAAALYLFLGSLAEGLFLLVGAGIAVGLVILQEARSERALAALRDLGQPHARVMRDGRECRIPARELVQDDILLIGEGERLPADGLVLVGDVIEVDESALTGESVPVVRRPAGLTDAAGGSDPEAPSESSVLAGTLVVRGQAAVRVLRTGTRSALGRIGAALGAATAELTPLQRTAKRLVTALGVAAVLFCLLVLVIYGTLRDDWIGGALAGITVAIGLIPEEFPMVLAVFLALGAWRLARRNVLVRRSAVIETLGGATVLCVDKTGTLTQNRMQIVRLWGAGGELDASPSGGSGGAASRLLHTAMLASAVRPIDPMDKAVHAHVQGRGDERAGDLGEPARTWPLRPELLAVVQLWHSRDHGTVAAAKGAPEAIFRLCRLSPEETSRAQAVVASYAAAGLRVLGVASANATDGFPEDPLFAAFELVGLIGFADPLRQDVQTALEEARRGGIAVIMITGDHPETAAAIAREAGLDLSGGVVNGAELEALSSADLAKRLGRVRVFARIAPAQKLRIVEALRTAGHIVAMTGDGVNDAPALEAAHIGIAMGRKGTDVAREAADLVLLDDSFASIIGGVRLGRRIFANLRRALTYITAIHVPIAGLAVLPILAGMPPLLFPMHVVLLELVIDPTCALVFEAEPSERDAMARPPRARDEALFGPPQIAVALIQGGTILVGVMAIYAWALSRHSVEEARGAALIALVIGNLVLALADASSGHLFASGRRAFWLIFASVCVALAAVVTIPAVAALFAVARPDPALLAASFAVAMLTGGGMSLLTLWFGRGGRGGGA